MKYRTVISILLTVLLVGGLAFYMNIGVQESENAKNEPLTEEKSQPEEKELTQEEIRESIEKKRKMALEKELNPFGYAVSQEELKDVHFRRYIHGMTHQKIIADDDNAKWRGYFKITDERIQWLLEGLDKTKKELENEKEYRDILERWAKGDFSRVDDDHNIVWELQGGNYGKAIGIMTPEQEKRFIENTPEFVPVRAKMKGEG